MSRCLIFLICFTDPEVIILMESAFFILSAPSGDLTPTVAGAPAPSLVPGKVGSALRLEGAELNYGQPSTECFYDVGLCTEGMTVSLWVKFYASSTSPQMILDGGGFYPQTKGMSMFLSGHGFIQINIFDDNDRYIIEAPCGDPSNWQHIIFTWKVLKNILLYLNGCPAGVQIDPTPHGPVTTPADFKIGGNLWGGAGERGNIALDHVLMWYGVLTPEEVWQLYVQGGQV